MSWLDKFMEQSKQSLGRLVPAAMLEENSSASS